MMKKKLFFTFACAMALIAGFVSCTNDDFEELAPVAEMQKSAMTRSASGMTKEEVQARLDEIAREYGAAVMIADDQDLSSVSEDYFIYVDNFLKNRLSADRNDDILIMDDNCIDAIAVESTSLATLLLEDGVLYSGSFLEGTVLNCVINWAVTSNPITYYVFAEPIIKDGTSNAFIDYFSPFSGDLSNPRFGYSGYYYSLNPIYVNDTTIINKPLLPELPDLPAPIEPPFMEVKDHDKNNDGLLDEECFIGAYSQYFLGGKTKDTEPYDM